MCALVATCTEESCDVLLLVAKPILIANRMNSHSTECIYTVHACTIGVVHIASTEISPPAGHNTK